MKPKFNSKEWKRYWMGKAPRTRAAVEEFLTLHYEKNPQPYGSVGLKFKVSEATMVKHIGVLRKTGIIRKEPFLHGKTKGTNYVEYRENVEAYLKNIRRKENKED